MSEWWVPFYDDAFAETMLAEPPPRATVDFLIERLELSAGDRVLDQCCGTGGLAIALAQRGCHVVGVDQAAGYLERAEHASLAMDVTLELVHADAFEYVATPVCRAAINWATSFGYADDERNARMLENAFASLAPGGRFALDTMNLPSLLRNFQRHLELRKTTSFGEITLWRDSLVDLAHGRLEKCWRYQLPDGREIEHTSSVRLHQPHELIAMLVAVGFAEVQLFGSVDGSPLDIDSPRCIALARRPP